MFCLLIDPFQKSIEYIEGDINNLDWLYEKLDCETIDVLTLPHYGGNSLVVDDNGLLKPTGEQAYFKLGGGVLAGRALLVSTNIEGDFCEPSWNQADAWREVKWLPHDVGAAFAAQFQ